MTTRDSRVLILVDAGGADATGLVSSVTAALGSMAAIVAPASVRCLAAASPDALAGTHVAAMFAGTLAFDIAVDICAPDIDAIDDETWRELAAVLDRAAGGARRSVVAGRQWRSDGDPLRFGMWLFNTRLPGMTNEGFVHHWRHTHARIDVPPVKAFCQMYSDAEATARVAQLVAATPLVYDGISGPSWDDEQEFREFMLDDRLRIGAAQDELGFIDHTRSHAAVTTVVDRSAMIEDGAGQR